jgi:DNA-binding transcriptional ArsR family regulator
MATDLLSTIAGEIETRMRELRPALAEYERLLEAAAALASEQAATRQPARSARPASSRRVSSRASSSRRPAIRLTASATATAAKPKRAVRGAAREAILAALEHGSHTVGELVAVTAMTAANVNGNVRRLLSEGAIAKTLREGKVAYELPSA